MNVSTYLKEAIKIAHDAGKMIKAASELAKHIDTKENSADLVTKTDRAVEEFIFNRLRHLFPDHVLIGEESASKSINQLTASPTWIVDPIDGTTNFVHGFPFFCVSIGFCLNRKPVVGVIYNPILGQLFYASEGNGSFIKEGSEATIVGASPKRLGEKIIELPSSLSEALLTTEYGASKSLNHLNAKLDMIKTFLSEPTNGRGVRSVGSAALSMCLIAQGAVDLYYEAGVHAWDVCAGCVIVKEAGGIVRNWSQNEFDVLDRTVVCVRPSNEVSPTILKDLLSFLLPISYPRD